MSTEYTPPTSETRTLDLESGIKAILTKFSNGELSLELEDKDDKELYYLIDGKTDLALFRSWLAIEIDGYQPCADCGAPVGLRQKPTHCSACSTDHDGESKT